MVFKQVLFDDFESMLLSSLSFTSGNNCVITCYSLFSEVQRKKTSEEKNPKNTLGATQRKKYMPNRQRV